MTAQELAAISREQSREIDEALRPLMEKHADQLSQIDGNYPKAVRFTCQMIRMYADVIERNLDKAIRGDVERN